MICNILERIVKANILQYIKTASLLTDAQHGFVPRRSYLKNLIIAEELITGITDQGEPVDVVYLDFSKAFDSFADQEDGSDGDQVNSAFTPSVNVLTAAKKTWRMLYFA